MKYSEAPYMPGCPLGEQLPVDRISPRGSLRPLQENVSLAALADSIRMCGLMRPVIVRRTVTGRYVIISGNRRLMACRMLGMACIPARVLQDDAPWQSAERLLNALLVRQMHYLEEADALRVLHEMHAMTWEELARILMADAQWLCRLARLNTIREETRALLMEEDVPLSIAFHLLRLPDDQRRHDVAERIAAQRLCVRDSALLVTAELRQMTRTHGGESGAINGVNNGKIRPDIQENVGIDRVNNGNIEKRKQHVIRVIRDERLYINAIRDIAGQMQEAGVKAIVAERWSGGQLEMIIRVPARRRRMDRYQQHQSLS